MYNKKHKKKGEENTLEQTTWRTFRTRFTKRSRRRKKIIISSHLSEFSDMKSQNRVKVFFSTFHTHSMLLLMPWKSEFHAHYFWYSSVWFSKWDCKLTKKIVEGKFLFVSSHSTLSPWQHTPHQDRTAAIKKPRNFNITILSLPHWQWQCNEENCQRRYAAVKQIIDMCQYTHHPTWWEIHEKSHLSQPEMTQYNYRTSDAPKRCNSLAFVGSSP